MARFTKCSFRLCINCINGMYCVIVFVLFSVDVVAVEFMIMIMIMIFSFKRYAIAWTLCNVSYPYSIYMFLIYRWPDSFCTVLLFFMLFFSLLHTHTHTREHRSTVFIELHMSFSLIWVTRLPFLFTCFFLCCSHFCYCFLLLWASAA